MYRTNGGKATLVVAAALLFTGCGSDSPTSPPAQPTPTAGLSQVIVTPSSVTGGDAAQGEVRLTAPAPSSQYVVNVTSSAPAASVPTSVTIPSGATSATFAIATQPVASEIGVTIGASANGEARSATLVVNPPAGPAVGQLLVDASFEGGATSAATVRLDKPATASEVVVVLTSDNAALTVPVSVIVPIGSSSSTFSVFSRVVTAETRVTVSASAGGQTRTAEIRLRPRAVAPAPSESFFTFASASGDYIGQGKSGTYRTRDARFTANTCRGNQVLTVDVRINSTEYWSLNFMAPQGALTPGTYVDNSTGAPVAGQPSFSVSSSGRGCNGVGRFVVTEADYFGNALMGFVNRFRATFEQRCTAGAPLLTGEISLIYPPAEDVLVLC